MALVKPPQGSALLGWMRGLLLGARFSIYHNSIKGEIFGENKKNLFKKIPFYGILLYEVLSVHLENKIKVNLLKFFNKINGNFKPPIIIVDYK